MASLRPVLPLILANTQEREGEPLKAGTVMLPYLAASLRRLRAPALSKVRFVIVWARWEFRLRVDSFSLYLSFSVFTPI